MEQSQRTQKVNSDTKTNPHELKVGDLVYIKRERLPSQDYKLSQRFGGTYKILSFTSATNVELLDILDGYLYLLLFVGCSEIKLRKIIIISHV